MTRRLIPLSKADGLREPGPVFLRSTARKGRLNLMPFSGYMPRKFKPPLLGCASGGCNLCFGTHLEWDVGRLRGFVHTVTPP